jgi:hypothetical protein
MADDIALNPGSGGKTVRAYDDGTREWPVGLVAYPTGGASGSYTLQVVDLAHGLPVVGTVTANIGTAGTLALDATLTGGTAVAKAVGDVAHDAVDSGNPVKVGGKANTGAQAAVAVGDRVDLWLNQFGAAVTAPLGTNSVGDSVSGVPFNNATGTAVGAVALMAQDGDGFWSRYRNNHEVTVLASAARTASVNSSDQTNFNARGVVVVVDITAGGGAGSLTVKLTGKDTLSG